MINRNLQRFRQMIRDLGRLDGWLYALGRILAMVSHGRIRLYKYYFVAQPVPAKPWLPPQRGRAIQVRRVFESDSLNSQFPRPAWAIPYRYGQGAICLAALQADKCIGFLWFTLGPYQEDEVRCRYVPLPEGRAAWDFDVYLDSDHRNGIAFLRLWDEANRFLMGHQIRWSLSRISAFNKNSIFSHTRMGARRIASATFLAAGPIQICVATTHPYLHFSMQADSYPVFFLSSEGGGKPAR